MNNRLGIDRFKSSTLKEFEAGWQTSTFANGMRCIYHPGKDNAEFYIGTVIKVGSRYETPARRGISHFLEHMMFRGSKSYPSFLALAEAFEWQGGEWNAATGHEHTEYWYSGIEHGAEAVIPLFAEFLQEPLLLDLELERQVIGREIEGELNEFGHWTDLDLYVAREFWPETGLAEPIFGDSETVSNIHLHDLQSHRQQHYHPENMVVWSVGGEKPDSIAELLKQHFGNWQHSPANKQSAFSPKQIPSELKGPFVKSVNNSDNEFEIQLSFQTEGEWSESTYPLELICRILSDGFCSRLTRKLREEAGLVYDIDADASQHSDVGTLDICAAITPDKAVLFLTELLKVLQTLVQDGPTADEVERASIRSLVDLELAPTEPEEIATQMCWAALSGQETSLVKDRDGIIACDVPVITGHCRQIFRSTNAALIIFGPEDPTFAATARQLLEQYL